MSERKFSVGDCVRILPSRIPSVHAGTVAVVTDGPRAIRIVQTGELVEGYEVDLPTEFPEHAARWPRAWFGTYRLEPYYDGNERVSWSSCEWQPKQVSA